MSLRLLSGISIYHPTCVWTRSLSASTTREFNVLDTLYIEQPLAEALGWTSNGVSLTFNVGKLTALFLYHADWHGCGYVIPSGLYFNSALGVDFTNLLAC